MFGLSNIQLYNHNISKEILEEINFDLLILNDNLNSNLINLIDSFCKERNKKWILCGVNKGI